MTCEASGAAVEAMSFPMPVRLCFLVVCLVLPHIPASAQEGLRLHEAVTPEAPGDTTGLRQVTLATAAGSDVHLGRPVLELATSDIQTVGLEGDGDGTGVLSIWLVPSATRRLEAVTAAASGRALAVVHDGRVLGAPLIAGPVTNGLVMLPGLRADDARTVAATLRGEAAPARVAPSPPRRPTPGAWGRSRTGPHRDVPRRPLPASRPFDPAPPPDIESGATPAETPLADRLAEDVALAFVRAVARRMWGAAADVLHPDAQAAIRPDALATLRLDGALVRVRQEAGEERVRAADVLGRTPTSLESLSDRDLAALHLAGLEALGAWGAPESGRRVVGTVDDGALSHVVLRGDAPVNGLSEVSVVTLRRDAAGDWRVVLTEARGF